MNGNNTDFASRLDFEQQIDHEFEQHPEVDIEVKERKAFMERCRRAKVTYTKLKKYEKEVDERTKELKTEIKLLEWKLKNNQVGVRNKIFGSRACKQKDIDRWRKQLDDKRKQLDLIITWIHEKYFK